MKQLITKTILVLLIGIMSGCSYFNKKNEDENNVVEVVSGSSDGPVTTQGIEPGSGFYGEETTEIKLNGEGDGYFGERPWSDPANPLSDKIIYFMFDSTEVQQEYQDLIAKHAEYLAANLNLTVTMEGHADERGTREYNVALSEQRANSVAKIMKLLGVDDSQIEIVSYGEEKPAELGYDESAWSLNRRVEIRYPN